MMDREEKEPAGRSAASERAAIREGRDTFVDRARDRAEDRAERSRAAAEARAAAEKAAREQAAREAAAKAAAEAERQAELARKAQIAKEEAAKAAAAAAEKARQEAAEKEAQAAKDAALRGDYQKAADFLNGPFGKLVGLLNPVGGLVVKGAGALAGYAAEHATASSSSAPQNEPREREPRTTMTIPASALKPRVTPSATPDVQTVSFGGATNPPTGGAGVTFGVDWKRYLLPGAAAVAAVIGAVLVSRGIVKGGIFRA